VNAVQIVKVSPSNESVTQQCREMTATHYQEKSTPKKHNQGANPATKNKIYELFEKIIH